VAGIPATRYFGLQGVIWSMIFANALYVVVAFILYGRKVAALTISGVNAAEPVSAE
jgi:hypothetical protein